MEGAGAVLLCAGLHPKTPRSLGDKEASEGIESQEESLIERRLAIEDDDIELWRASARAMRKHSQFSK